MNARHAAVLVLTQVIQHHRSLTDALNDILPGLKNPADRALAQAICYGVMRWYLRLDFIATRLLSKPLKNKDQDMYYLILVGLYQLIYMRIPDHAAVSETVNLTRALKKNWARALVNGVLRNYQRKAETLQAQADENDQSRYGHPDWLIKRLKQAWPEHWPAILEANNQQAPMSLRVNARQHKTDDYLNLLADKDISATTNSLLPHALILDSAVAVENLPGFAEGSVSVQDCAAQLSAQLLCPQADDYILDACAAPGGKTAHILELQPALKELVALDIDQGRTLRISDTLSRLGLQANVLTGDAAKPDSWWNRQPFDRILLDAPCSASGVIRRHPDIKYLRRSDDIHTLVKTQQTILSALWPLLKPGGMLLYATCSVLPDENTKQIEQFLASHTDAREEVIDAAWGHTMPAGKQILPGEEGMDGFYYACLYKV